LVAVLALSAGAASAQGQGVGAGSADDSGTNPAYGGRPQVEKKPDVNLPSGEAGKASEGGTGSSVSADERKPETSPQESDRKDGHPRDLIDSGGGPR
jgi:hypothetical protein